MGWFQRSHLDVVEEKLDDFDTSDNVSSNPDYSIEDVMSLFNGFPNQGSDIEAAAVVRTLSSFDVNLDDVMDDANTKEEFTKKRLKVLQLEIALFKAKIQKREKEIALLDVGLNEMAKTKKRLRRGEKIVNGDSNTLIPILKNRILPINKIKRDRAKPIAEQIRRAATKEVFAKTQKIDLNNLRKAKTKIRKRVLRKKSV